MRQAYDYWQDQPGNCHLGPASEAPENPTNKVTNHALPDGCDARSNPRLGRTRQAHKPSRASGTQNAMPRSPTKPSSRTDQRNGNRKHACMLRFPQNRPSCEQGARTPQGGQAPVFANQAFHPMPTQSVKAQASPPMPGRMIAQPTGKQRYPKNRIPTLRGLGR